MRSRNRMFTLIASVSIVVVMTFLAAVPALPHQYTFAVNAPAGMTDVQQFDLAFRQNVRIDFTVYASENDILYFSIYGNGRPIVDHTRLMNLAKYFYTFTTATSGTFAFVFTDSQTTGGIGITADVRLVIDSTLLLYSYEPGRRNYVYNCSSSTCGP
ncbi:hypothetical protein J2P12_04735 [Candidatus Bathyarchaeota archaeon]|nr:hypothetical protein [Candidatus Bathyarchaeota archaeon]